MQIFYCNNRFRTDTTILSKRKQFAYSDVLILFDSNNSINVAMKAAEAAQQLLAVNSLVRIHKVVVIPCISAIFKGKQLLVTSALFPWTTKRFINGGYSKKEDFASRGDDMHLSWKVVLIQKSVIRGRCPASRGVPSGAEQ